MQKLYFFELYQEYLCQNGVEKEQIRLDQMNYCDVYITGSNACL